MRVLRVLRVLRMLRVWGVLRAGAESDVSLENVERAWRNRKLQNVNLGKMSTLERRKAGKRRRRNAGWAAGS